MTFSSKIYEVVYKRPPRGRGLWIFNIRSWPQGPLLEQLKENGLFTDAKRMAMQRAKELGGGYIEVCC